MRAAAAAALPLLALLGRGTGAFAVSLGLRHRTGTAARGLSSQGACAGARRGIFADGYYRVNCATDASPKEARYYFADLVCKGLPACSKQKKKMSPDVCFEFCREYPVNFFAIQGDTCYCTSYYHPKSTQGGQCDFHCAGDAAQICGSKFKASIFEQHLCGDSAGEAQAALQATAEAKSKANATAEAATQLSTGLVAMSDIWDLGICSASKQNVCDLKGYWKGLSSTFNKAVAAAEHEVYECGKKEAKLVNLTKVVAAGNGTGSDYSKMELQAKSMKKEVVDINVAAGKVETLLKTTAGPLAKAQKLADFGTLFRPLANASMKGTHAICDLQVLKQFSAVAADDPSVCGGYCLGKDECVAFNYQHKGGVTACQMLKRDFLVKPKFLFAVPVFEISNSKVSSMPFAAIECYAKTVFMNDNGRGATKVAVVKQIVVEE